MARNPEECEADPLIETRAERDAARAQLGELRAKLRDISAYFAARQRVESHAKDPGALRAAECYADAAGRLNIANT